jgi:hypothetical protein
MKFRLSFVPIILGILLIFVTSVSAQLTPVATEVRTYLNGNSATITIWALNFPPNSLVRLDKEADELALDNVSRIRYSTTSSILADAGGNVYWVDVARINSFYTYTFTANDGARLVVPVTTQVHSQPGQFYMTQCNATLPTRLRLGAQARAMSYQIGYTRATSDALYADETNIALFAGVPITVVNGPVCDGQGQRWWQVVTMNNTMEYDQIMYVREHAGSNYLLEPLGTVVEVADWRYLPGDNRYWTPASSRFRINKRALPTWCQDDFGAYRGERIAQARFGDRLVVTAMTSDTRWVQILLSDGRSGWVSTHLGSINFFAPYLAYGNTAGVFVAPPPVWDPIPAWGSCDW